MDTDKITEQSHNAAKSLQVENNGASFRLATVTLLFNIQAILLDIADKLEVGENKK